MRNLSNYKQGMVKSSIAIVVFLFTFAILCIIGYLMLASYCLELSHTSYWDSNMNYVCERFLFSIAMGDYIIVFLMVILIAGIAVTSYKLASRPVFFIVMFFMAALEGYVAYIFNYIFSQIVSQSVFTTTVAHFPITLLICTNLHWVALVSIVIGSIALYGKEEKGQYLS